MPDVERVAVAALTALVVGDGFGPSSCQFCEWCIVAKGFQANMWRGSMDCVFPKKDTLTEPVMPTCATEEVG